MKPSHIALGVLITAIWGVNFSLIKVALHDIPPLLLTAERFTFACLPAFFLPRPKGLTLPYLLVIGLTMFLGQYIFLFHAMALGFPAGLSSTVLQVQAFFTILIAGFALREWPKPKQIAGCCLALLGLAAIATTAGNGSEISLIALFFLLASAITWAIGNVAMRKAGPTAGGGTLANIAWLSLVPPIPAFLLSVIFEGWPRVETSLNHPTLSAMLALGYIVVFSTWLAFAIWGKLLATYPAVMVAPFTLLVPGFGATAAWLILGESLSPMRLVGTALIIGGLLVILIPARKKPLVHLKTPPPVPK